MFCTRSILAMILSLGVVGQASHASAKDIAVAMSVTKVSGIRASCPRPAEFLLSYSENRKSMKLGGATTRKMKNGTKFRQQQVADGIGRQVVTNFNFKKRVVTVSEVAVALKGRSSCKFNFQGKL